jgi:hypothetical protein
MFVVNVSYYDPHAMLWGYDHSLGLDASTAPRSPTHRESPIGRLLVFVSAPRAFLRRTEGVSQTMLS